MAATEHGPVVVVVEPPPLPYSDGQIASITDAANTSEVEQGTLAQSKARDARVKKFAAMMIVDHSQAKKQQADLLTRLGITPIETKKSAAILEESNRTLESLRALGRNEFDRAYIDVQVDAHQKVLDSFDNELIPNTKNSEFKAALVEFRPQVESHLKEAQDIQQALASAPLSPIGKSGTEGVRHAPHGGKQPAK
jgi:putative membrane protein